MERERGLPAAAAAFVPASCGPTSAYRLCHDDAPLLVPQRRLTLLMAAAKGGHTDLVRALVQRGASLKATDAVRTGELLGR